MWTWKSTALKCLPEYTKDRSPLHQPIDKFDTLASIDTGNTMIQSYWNYPWQYVDLLWCWLKIYIMTQYINSTAYSMTTKRAQWSDFKLTKDTPYLIHTIKL